MRKEWYLTLLLSVLPLGALAAPQPKVLDRFGEWTIYRHFEGRDKPVCYMAAPPAKTESKVKNRAQSFLLITHRPADKTFNVVSYVAGYDLNEKLPVMLDIDDTDFIMIPNDDMAWMPDQAADDRVADAIKRGKKLVIVAAANKKRGTIDTFDLSGSAKALEAIGKACTKTAPKIKD